LIKEGENVRSRLLVEKNKRGTLDKVFERRGKSWKRRGERKCPDSKDGREGFRRAKDGLFGRLKKGRWERSRA